MGKAHDPLKDSCLSDAGDSSREKGGTQESLTVRNCKIWSYMLRVDSYTSTDL